MNNTRSETAEDPQRVADGTQAYMLAARVLRSLRYAPEGLAIDEIAARVETLPPTVERMVNAFVAEGILLQASDSGRVQPGAELLALAASPRLDVAGLASRSRVDMVDIAHPLLKTLAEATGETVHLSVFRTDHVVFVDQIVGVHRLRAVSTVGEVFPPHSTANGKACLALLSDDEVRARLGGEELPLAEGTRSIDDLLAELAEIRRRGIAFDEEEHSLGISAVGTAFTDGLGAIYAVSIPAPTSRFAQNREKFASLVLDMRHRVIAAVGERQREIMYQGEKLGALGSLLAGVAHELNNPLSVVVAQSAMLQEMATDPKTAARSEKIRNAAERCVRIVKTFLAMARQKPPSRSAVDLNHVIDAAVELLDYGLRTAGIAVHLELARSVPSVWGDPDQIGQVLLNLIANAQQALADFNGPRRLVVTTAFDEGDRMVRLTVADSGPGVPPGIRTRIFEPFFTTKPVGIGTGIGLAVCNSIVTSHGGTIAVEDAEGGGASFVVRLPIEKVGEAAASAQAGPRAVAPRLLVIDDEAEMAEALSDIFSQAGYDVDIVESGRAGLERIAAGEYDLVVSDAHLEDMDGVAFYTGLKERKPALADRLILVTNDAPGGAILRFLDDAGVRYLEKPFRPAEIRRIAAERTGAAKPAVPR